MLKIKNLSFLIDEKTPLYGGINNLISIKNERSITRGDKVNTSRYNFPNHISTHIDFPYHFSENGKKLEDYPPEFWYFNKVGFIKSDVNNVTNHLEKLDKSIEILILKTGFGSKRNSKKYWMNQPIIRSELADIFREKFKKLRVFGFDLISLTSQIDKIEGTKAHNQFLLKNNILVLEDMNLEHLNDCPDKIIISPLLIKGADGVPCNVISINEK